MSDQTGSPAAAKVLANAQALGEGAKQVGQQAMQAGTDALGQAKDVVGDARARAGSLAGEFADKASSVAETQKSGLADRLEDVAKAVHRSGEQLEGHQDWVAHLVERGAAELNMLATTLRSNDLQSLVGDLGSLARRQPALFVGASMAAGFALARVGRLAAAAAPAPAQPPASAQPSPTTPATPIGGVPEVTSERR